MMNPKRIAQRAIGARVAQAQRSANMAFREYLLENVFSNPIAGQRDQLRTAQKNLLEPISIEILCIAYETLMVKDSTALRNAGLEIRTGRPTIQLTRSRLANFVWQQFGQEGSEKSFNMRVSRYVDGYILFGLFEQLDTIKNIKELRSTELFENLMAAYFTTFARSISEEI